MKIGHPVAKVDIAEVLWVFPILETAFDQNLYKQLIVQFKVSTSMLFYSTTHVPNSAQVSVAIIPFVLA